MCGLCNTYHVPSCTKWTLASAPMGESLTRSQRLTILTVPLGSAYANTPPSPL